MILLTVCMIAVMNVPLAAFAGSQDSQAAQPVRELQTAQAAQSAGAQSLQAVLCAAGGQLLEDVETAEGDTAGAINPFRDVSTGNWFYEAVMYVNSRGLMRGMSEDTFEPQTQTSRAMLVTILYRMEGEPETSGGAAQASSSGSTADAGGSGGADGTQEPGSADSAGAEDEGAEGNPGGFIDVPEGTWYTKAVVWAAKAQVVNGVGDGRFAPSDNITREQIAAILYRYSGGRGINIDGRADLSGFSDRDSISNYAQDAMCWAVADGLIQGRDADTLAPKANATRAEIATILMRYCRKYADSSSGDNQGSSGGDSDDNGNDGGDPGSGGDPSDNTGGNSGIETPEIENYIDAPLPDIEIGSFSASPSDVLIGESSSVTFYADVFQEIELEDQDVGLYDENDRLLGYMTAMTGYDEAYSLTLELNFDTVGVKEYYCKVKDVISDPCEINFYRHYTDEDLELRDEICSALDSVTAEFKNEAGYVQESDLETVDSKLETRMNRLAEDGKTESFSVEDNVVSITTSTGYPFVYTIGVEGWLVAPGYTSVSENTSSIYSSANEEVASSTPGSTGSGLSIATYEPFYSDQGEQYGINPRNSNGEISQYKGSTSAATDLPAQTMVDSLGAYGASFDGNFDDEDVSIEELKYISDYDVILWGGHGYANRKYGSVLYTGEKITNQKNKNDYSADIAAGRIVDSSTYGTYGVTGAFFRHYLSEGSLNGAFIYLGACCSINDKYYDQKGCDGLAQALIDKGAAAVVGFTSFTARDSGYGFQKEMLEKMTEINSATGKYYSAGEAFQIAKKDYYHNGYLSKAYQSVAAMFPDSGAVNAEDYRLIDFGWTGGRVIKAESGDGISYAKISVYTKNGKLVGSTRSLYYYGSGGYLLRLPAGEYVLRVSSSSRRTVKMAVTVTANSYTENDVVMLPKPGYFDGNVNGLVRHTLTYDGIEGATLSIRRNWYNRYGTVLQEELTNENGYYETTLGSGFYTVVVEKEGYDPRMYNILLWPFGSTEWDFWLGSDQQYVVAVK